MKYIKKYEGFDNPRIPELKKLLSHLIKVFSDMGYDYNSYLINNDYQTNFLNDNKERVFDIGGDFSRTIV